MTKRVIITTILGLIAGILCYIGTKSSTQIEYNLAMTIENIFNRMIIGFLIGVSGWKMDWAIHGITMGFIGGSPLWLASIQSGINALIIMLIASIVWGILIELITTKVFKAPQLVLTQE